MKNVLFVTILIIFIVTKAESRNFSTLTPVIVEANYDKFYIGNLNSKTEHIFVYKRVNNSFPKETRVSIESNATLNFPLTIVVNKKAEVLFWQIPLLENSNYYNTSRTLCSTNKNMNSTTNEEMITVSLSTASNTEVGFKIKLISIKDFHLRINEVREDVRISPSEPVYYSYSFDKNPKSKSVIVQLTSESEICMLLSVQRKSCPILDLEKNVEHSEYWQTVSKQGAITVSKEELPEGFFIVLIAKLDDYECTRIHNADSSKNILSNSSTYDRIKFVNLSVQSGKLFEDYIIGCTIFATLIVCFLTIYIVSLFLYYKQSTFKKCSMIHLENLVLNQIENNFESSTTDEKETKKLIVYVCDLSKKKPIDLEKRSNLYMYYLVTVSVFYILPVMQLVTTNQIILQESGNQDLCYYNFLCAQPLWFLSAFNNVFSNLGYTLFGILFILITQLREKHFNAENHQTLKGIPQNYGLFYSMGMALMLEGVLSASYHFCPSRSNFQFDTSFMYIISVLCMVKIYQSRHPDVHARAPVTFGVLALMIFLALVGVLDRSITFSIIFTIIHLTFFSIMIAEVYNLGRQRFHGGLLKTSYISMKYDLHKMRENYLGSSYVMRVLFFLLSIGVNIFLAICNLILNNKEFDMYLLLILMVNLILYICFYGFMKYFENERILFQPSIFIILSILTWFGAFYFYMMNTTFWELPPAQSRNYNEPCILFNFFDTHDIWHFLSALAMFFSFMILLTIDDDLIDVPRNQIPVF